MKTIVRRLSIFCDSIKVAHSVFALPFAVAAVFLAAEGWPEAPVLGKVVLAVVLARTAAMAFNRFADARIDAQNPRTASRAIPSGLLSARFMLTASLLSGALFVAVAGWINPLALKLSPVVLIVLLGYSYTKRFTALSHVVLGAALGLSPLGAWVAVRGELAIIPALLGAAVLLWTAGFDVIYACQDEAFDRRHGLHSIPSRLGITRALLLARLFHVGAVALLISLGFLASQGIVYGLGVLTIVALLVYEHSIVSPRDLSRVNVAFFTLNGLVSLAFMTAVVIQAVI